MGSGMNSPEGSVWDTLAWAQVKHYKTYLLISCSMLGHQYFTFKSLYVRLVPGCPVAGDVWAQLMSLPLNSGATNVQLGGHLAGAWLGRALASSWSSFQLKEFTKHDVGRMCSGSVDSASLGNNCESVSALVFFDPSQYEIRKLKCVKSKGPPGMPRVKTLGCV